MTDRDHFAAAALTGLLVHANDGIDEETLDAPSDIAYTAYAMADAMLRERSRTGQIGSGGTDAAAKCTDRDSANLDASPEATASVETVAPQPTTRGDSDRTDKAAPRPSEGTGDTPDSPKPIKGGVSDRSKPINGPDPDSRVWETPVHTPATHATRGEGSEQRECTEPVAWGVVYPNDEVAVIAFKREDAEERATASDRVVPLYRHPPCQDVSQKNLTLTDAEREAIERGYCSLMGVEDMSAECTRWDAEAAAVLRGLLERTGGEK